MFFLNRNSYATSCNHFNPNSTSWWQHVWKHPEFRSPGAVRFWRSASVQDRELLASWTLGTCWLTSHAGENMGVSENRGGPPKSSILMRFCIINHPFWGTPIFANIHSFHCFMWLLEVDAVFIRGESNNHPLAIGFLTLTCHICLEWNKKIRDTEVPYRFIRTFYQTTF